MGRGESFEGPADKGLRHGRLFLSASGSFFEREFASVFEEDPEEAELADEAVARADHIKLVEDGEGVLEFHGPPPVGRYLEAEALPVAFVDGVRRAEAAIGYAAPHLNSHSGRNYAGLLGVVGAGGVLRPGRSSASPLAEVPLQGLLFGGYPTVPWEYIDRYTLWEVTTPQDVATTWGLHLDGRAGPISRRAPGEDPLHYRPTRAGFRPRDETPADLTGMSRQLSNELNSRMQQAEGTVMLRATDEISRTLEHTTGSHRAYVITDGPLVKPGLSLGRSRPTGSVTLAGFAKTHTKRYLKPDEHEALSTSKRTLDLHSSQ